MKKGDVIFSFISPSSGMVLVEKPGISPTLAFGTDIGDTWNGAPAIVSASFTPLILLSTCIISIAAVIINDSFPCRFALKLFEIEKRSGTIQGSGS